MDAPPQQASADEKALENRRTSLFQEQATAHTGRETIGVKDNECVEPPTADTAASIRDDDDGGLCSQSRSSCRRDPNAGGK